MLAQSYFWWPGFDADIEREVKGCESCLRNANAPPSAPLHPWEWPSRPWFCLHVDNGGPFENHMFLVVGDAYSKWIEVFKTNSSATAVTEQRLRECFSTHGLPDVIVTSFTMELLLLVRILLFSCLRMATDLLKDMFPLSKKP